MSMNQDGRLITDLPVHGGQLHAIAARYGVPVDQLIDFSANINPAGPPASVLAAMQAALLNPETLATYPDLEETKLKQAIADAVAVRRENVSVANGFVPLLEASLRSLDIRRCLLPVPSFSEYRRALERAKVAVTPYPLSSKKQFEYEPDAIRDAMVSGSQDAILLANPQNPSGAVCDAARMLELIEMAARHEMTVLLDEAFIDYAPNQSLTQHAMHASNLIVFRSVTKFFGLPGLRVAYAVSHPERTQLIDRCIAPWPVTSLASCGVCAALGDEGYAEHSRQTNSDNRLWLEEELHRLGIEVYPSGANFLLIRLPSGFDPGLLWERMIVDHRIVLRSCANFEALEAGHFRFAIRSAEDNERLIRGLTSLLAGW